MGRGWIRLVWRCRDIGLTTAFVAAAISVLLATDWFLVGVTALVVSLACFLVWVFICPRYWTERAETLAKLEERRVRKAALALLHPSPLRLAAAATGVALWWALGRWAYPEGIGLVDPLALIVWYCAVRARNAFARSWGYPTRIAALAVVPLLTAYWWGLGLMNPEVTTILVVLSLYDLGDQITAFRRDHGTALVVAEEERRAAAQGLVDAVVHIEASGQA